jgi:uncharacterized protein (TIGR04141 family)
MSRTPLTAYLLDSRIGSVGQVESALREVRQEIAPGGDVREIRGFLVTAEPSPPWWADFVGEVMRVPVAAPANASSGAVICVEVRDPSGRPRVLAFTFGVSGYQLLNRARIERGFGLRSALNACFPKGSTRAGLTRLRSIDSKGLDDVALDTRQLASREVGFETFGMNIRTDLLQALVGQPADQDAWGPRVRGRDSFQASVQSAYRLEEIARRLLELYAKRDYRDHFPWVDNIRPVYDEEIVSRLEAATERAVKANRLDLIGPEELEARSVSYYRLRSDPRSNKRFSLRLADYVTKVGGSDAISIEALKTDWIQSYDDSGEVIAQKSVLECLAGNVDFDGSTFVLADGLFYGVDRDYLRQLDRDISDLPIYQGLPPCLATENEDAYNRRAAQRSDLLLVHPDTFTIEGRTTAIEPCDLYARNGAMIFVKKKERSSTLSHLFSQGAIGGELLVLSDGFCASMKELLKKKEAERSHTDPSYQTGMYRTMSSSRASRLKHEIVYALIARWGNTQLARGLPFFSKVNLRQRADDLGRLGLRVSVARVPVA